MAIRQTLLWSHDFHSIRKGAATRIRFVLFCVIVFPFVNIFGQLNHISPIFEGFLLSSYTNYFALLFAFYIFAIEKVLMFDRLVVILTALLFMFLVVNSVTTPLASIKWQINWLGFIFVSIALIQSIKNFTDNEMQYLEFHAFKWLFRLFSTLAILIGILWATNLQFFVDMLIKMQGDQINSILSMNAGIDKQAVGLVFSMLLIYIAIYFSRLTDGKKVQIALVLAVVLPSIIFIRTMFLAAAVLLLLLFFLKNLTRKLILLISVICLIPFLYQYSGELTEFVEANFDRLPSLKFAWSAMTENIFGLGNGGYHVYVAEYETQLVATFGSEIMLKNNMFWTAPESDLVYFIASWGVLSIGFFTFLAVLIFKGIGLLHTGTLNSVEKIMIVMAMVTILSGISQDNATSLIWWVYVSAGSAVVLRNLYKKKLQKRSKKFEVNASSIE